MTSSYAERGYTLMPVPAGRQPEPSPFARAFSSHVRIVMADKRVTTQALARAAGISRTYLGKRLRDEVPFSLNDVEAICKVLDMDLPKLPEI